MTVQFDWYGDDVKRSVTAARAHALTLGAGHLKDASNAVAPIEEGTMIQSSGIDVDGASGQASVYYDTVYAARQHEELTWRHKPGRTAKYRERPLHEESRHIQTVMGNALRAALGGGL